MLWRLLSGQHNELSRPVHLFSNLGLPCEFRQRRFFTNVVNTPGCLIRRCGKRDGMRDVLNVSTWGTPGGEIIGEQYRGSSIGNSLEQREESMKRISRTVHHRQP